MKKRRMPILVQGTVVRVDVANNEQLTSTVQWEIRPGDFANVENKHTQMYYDIRVGFSCVFPIS
jgi:hypothetical protein